VKTDINFQLDLSQFCFEREIFQANTVKTMKTLILCSVTFFSPEDRAVYEVTWKNIVKPERPQILIWRLRNLL